MEKNNYVAVTYTTNGYVILHINYLQKNNIDLKIKVFHYRKKHNLFSAGIEINSQSKNNTGRHVFSK